MKRQGLATWRALSPLLLSTVRKRREHLAALPQSAALRHMTWWNAGVVFACPVQQVENIPGWDTAARSRRELLMRWLTRPGMFPTARQRHFMTPNDDAINRTKGGQA
jgi:hypothetical protein